MDEDGFQINEGKKRGGQPLAVRLYLGGLPDHDELRQELHRWLEQTLPKHISVGAIEISHGGGRGMRNNSCFALIECGKHTNEAIRTLKGLSFEGNQLTVQREQRTAKTSNQKDDNQTKPLHRRGGTVRGGRGRNNGFSTTFNRKGWAKPSESNGFVDEITDPPEEKQEIEYAQPLTLEETSLQLSAIVSSEIERAGDDADQVINAALASTAAVTFLTSVLSSGDFSVDDSNNEFVENGSTPIEQPIMEPNSPAVDDSDFASFVKGQSLSALLTDFGEADPDWKKVEVPCVRTELSSPDQQQTASTEHAPPYQKFVSRLAPHRKAPIHICLESFGYVHGAPPRQSRDSSWSPYTQPLAPIDCRPLFEPAPSYLDFHDGLRSGQVKRLLLQQSRFGTKDDGQLQHDAAIDRPGHRDIQDYAKRVLARKEIWDALLEAQDVGGHGYASPLQMRVLVGSHLGRHRSVVVVEWAALELRNMLRKNKENAILQSVSVGTLHRDIEKRIPTRRYREDEEDDRIQ